MKSISCAKGFIVSISICIGVILFSNTVTATSTSTQHTAKADTLHTLGLFQGTELGFELERAPTRVEGAVMLVRLLGKEQEVVEKDFHHPFTDVPAWASSYIGYVYTNGIANGVSNVKFGSNDALSSQQYATFILRALGYEDNKGDFTWNTSLETMLKKSIINVTELTELQSKQFLRDDAVLLSYYALLSTMNSGQTLLENLKVQNVITDEQIETSLINGPTKLDTNQLPEVRVIVSSHMVATAYVDKTKLSDSMKTFHQFKVVKFNDKVQATQFESFMKNPKNATQIDVKVNEIKKSHPGVDYTNVIRKDIILNEELIQISQPPPFDTHLFLIYYDENDRVYAYSDYYIPFNKIDDLFAEIKYPIILNQLPKFENLYRIEHVTVLDHGQNNLISIYSSYYVAESFEAYQKQYGEFIFRVKFSSDVLIDVRAPLDNTDLKLKKSIISSFGNFKINMPEQNFTDGNKNYDYSIYFDYNFNVLGYSIEKIPKKVIE